LNTKTYRDMVRIVCIPSGILDREQVAFIDLDGTLTRPNINNTFDFLNGYLWYRYRMLGVLRYKLTGFIVNAFTKMFGLNEHVSRKLFLTLCLFGTRKERLYEYAVRYWLKIVRENLNFALFNLIIKLRREGYTRFFLATACTEIPACTVARFLGFEDCVATKFKYIRNLVVGVLEDTYGNLKLYLIAKKYGASIFEKSIYFVDAESAKIEKPWKFFRKICLVMWDYD